jgi:hypothetical protein
MKGFIGVRVGFVAVLLTLLGVAPLIREFLLTRCLRTRRLTRTGCYKTSTSAVQPP